MNRLRIQQRRIAGGRVTRVPDGQRARQAGKNVFGEDIGHQAHALCAAAESSPFGADDARRLLPAMLQRVQAEVSELGRFGMAVDGHHAAFFVKFVRFSISIAQPVQLSDRSHVASSH